MSSMRSAAISSRRPRAKLFWSPSESPIFLSLRPTLVSRSARQASTSALAEGGIASPVNCSRASMRKASAIGTCSRLVNEA